MLEEPPSACRNCGTPAPMKFCPECGQPTRLHPPSLSQFAHEFVSHYVAAEGKLWCTLTALLLRPGRLTVEYLAGRRQRYIAPLRLYLTASFIFFAAAQLSSHVLEVKVVTADDPEAKAALASLHSAEADAALQRYRDCLRAPEQCAWWWLRPLAPALAKLHSAPQATLERLAERWRHSLSYAMFCLLPVFAALLALAYRKRRMVYGEHLVFALHVHSFWFLLALLAAFLLPESLDDWFPLAALVYGMLAMQRVYGGRWWVTALRGVSIAIAYATIIGLGAAVLTIALLVT
jgi:uncharacterized protein DUF3667